MKIVKDNHEVIRTQIAAVAAQATAADKTLVQQILNQARTGDYQAEKVILSPAACAILFLEHNTFNREWDGTWSLELGRRVTEDEWQLNGDTIGFYKDGTLFDGQNRLAGHALVNQSLEVILVYGVDRKAQLTKDGGRRRYASDNAKLNGVENAARKEQIICAAARYHVRAGNKEATLHSEVQIRAEIERCNRVLDKAIELGVICQQNIVTPTLKEFPSQWVAYLLLQGGWPEDRVREKLAAFQTGVSKEGENTPFFVAAQLIERSRAAVNRKERLSSTNEIGVVILAMIETEKGTVALSRQKVKDLIKKQLPTPAYPSAQTDQAVA